MRSMASRPGATRHHVHFPRFSPDDQARLGEHPGVMGNGGLALGQRTFEVAAAHLALGGDDRQQPEPHGVAQGGEDGGEIGGFVVRQHGVGERGTAMRRLPLCSCTNRSGGDHGTPPARGRAPFRKDALTSIDMGIILALTYNQCRKRGHGASPTRPQRL